MTVSRRTFLASSGLALVSASAVSGRVAAAGIPEAPTQASPLMQPPLAPQSGPDYQPVVTLNGAPAVCAAGVPDFPGGMPLKKDSPGARRTRNGLKFQLAFPPPSTDWPSLAWMTLHVADAHPTGKALEELT